MDKVTEDLLVMTEQGRLKFPLTFNQTAKVQHSQVKSVHPMAVPFKTVFYRHKPQLLT